MSRFGRALDFRQGVLLDKLKLKKGKPATLEADVAPRIVCIYRTEV